MSFSDKVLICDQVDAVLNNVLQKNGLSVTYEPQITPEDLAKKIGDYEIIVVRSRTTITKELVEKATKCKIMARVGVGLDNIDTDAAKAKNIRVINAVEGAMNAVAELVLGLMLAMARDIPRADRELRNDKWIKKELMGTELAGKYLGIVGLGNIGKRLGRQSADYVSLHVPLLDSTKNLINAQRLSTMKKTARIINTSRGGTVDEEALYEALKSGNLGGAALDVFEKEPAIGNKLVSLPNFIATPHIGAQTKEAQSLAANVIAEKIIQILRGVI
ncbi:MAG: 3-phosphoglycerate dehydrogenase [Thaumarchaeota archaeon]|nr:3-phosphoglycerate dehydrogenase [Nitrososphaerota archaeon]